MVRLLVHVEGETEEAFVNEVLRPHLIAQGYENVGARLMGNARQRQRRGGVRSWASVRKDIIRHLQEDPGCISTTMVDYYAMPQNGDKAWPGRSDATSLIPSEKARTIEAALLADVTDELSTHTQRFVPFVVLHEFEGLLFSDCRAFAQGIGRTDLENSFQAIRDQFETPEDINDSPTTAPSKRVLELLPAYQKPLYGNVAAIEIGLSRIRESCPNFGNWIDRLETLARAA